jgi:Protein of unknown function (DUF1553)/Protein of unknown function (DUF1549)/Planctomycete cytochrome C
MFERISKLISIASSCVIIASISSLLSADDPIRFNRDIRPILSDNCFACHGPDAKHRQADLRLDVRQSAIELGALKEGKPDESTAIDRIESTDPESVMPPPSAHKKLSEKQKALLRRWVQEGAVYQDHWAFTPLERPPVPISTSASASTPAIDRFIDEGLQRVGIKASDRAPAKTLVRRLFLDLIGLPPSVREQDEWTQRVVSDGIVPLVDHLLASKHYGERMSVPWLDVVRYTDTVGYHGDQNQNIFPYRDYVIDAFNQNKPFDQFTIEQLAGDLLENPTEQQMIATGFNRLNMMTREGGAQPGEYMAKYAADRVRTVGMAWMGATIGCAECHDHKFDPFTTKDFYSLGAFFADVRQWGVYSDYASSPNKDLKGYKNDYPFPPELELNSPTLIEHQRLLEKQIDTAIAAVVLKSLDRNSLKIIRDWCAETISLLHQHSDGWLQPKFLGLDSKDETILTSQTSNVQRANTVNLASSIESSKDRDKDKSAKKKKADVLTTRTLRYALPAGRVSRIRVELFENSVSKNQLTRGDAASITVKVKAEISRTKAEKPIALTVYRAEADRFEIEYSSGQPRLGVESGWTLGSGLLASPAQAVYWIDAPVVANEHDVLHLKIDGDQLAGIRVSVSPLADAVTKGGLPAIEVLESIAKGELDIASPLSSSVLQSYFFSTRFDSRLHRSIHGLLNEFRACRNGKTWSMITVAQTPLTTRVLGRGNWQDETGDIVKPSVPGFLPQPKLPDGNQLTRLDLARWLVSRENPLTARVVVNRLWKQFFGNGLCTTVDDVGTQGDPPSHPELLDWLAVELIESGWDMKHVVKLMVTSQCYHRSSYYREDLRDSDPSNRLLAGQNPRRLDAEFVRDNALSIAGLLDLRLIGGPSCKPYQPADYYESLQFPDRDYVPNGSFAQFRRGVYMHWQRTFLHPMVANFDGPSREECIANRVSSNTPQQALTLLNDPSMVEAARVMAASLLRMPTPPRSNGIAERKDNMRIELAIRRALAREPSEAEIIELTSFLNEQRKHYTSDTEAAGQLTSIGISEQERAIPAGELAAWTALCRVILNLHETITRY